MKVVILAAGCGTRLKPLTDEVPKCMVKYNDKPIIDWVLDALPNELKNDIIVVGGYKFDVLKNHLAKRRDISFVFNPDFDSTNMVYSLFCALNEIDDDVIISYSDIIYTPSLFNKILDSKNEFCTVIDKDWFNYWSLRMSNPLEDAESLKTNSEGNISEIGKKSNSISEIQGQYIGLTKIPKKALRSSLKRYRKKLDKQNFNNMYMTDYLQSLIYEGNKLAPVYVKGDWMEFDCVSDLSLSSRLV
jgi:choline kinase